MVIGPSGPLPEKPKGKGVWVEDLDEKDLVAKGGGGRGGLGNEGNTCYLNSSLQVLREVEGLGEGLEKFQPTSSGGSREELGVTVGLKDLFKQMKETSSSVYPGKFISALRTLAPQFSERSRSSPNMYAQQDAQEAWSSILNALKNTKVGEGFVGSSMMGIMEKSLSTEEAPEEVPTVSEESFLELKCNIGVGTNYLLQGISEALDQNIEKTSSSLGREAVYKEVNRIKKLPTYLSISLIRFYWRREIRKKTKIMRRIKFPFDLDVTALCTPSLKASLTPLAEKLSEVEKDRRERGKVANRTQVNKGVKMDVDESADPGEVDVGEDEEEKVREGERKALRELASEEGGEGISGLYDLVGVVTHKGASADGGHYIAFTRIPPNKNIKTYQDPEKEMWYKFDDDKVSIVGRDKITQLEGGGEDHSAYILLYKSKSLE